MSDLSIVLNEKILLKLLKENPDFLLKIDGNYFLSSIGQAFYRTYKELYFNKKIDINDQSIILYGNKISNDINDSSLLKINETNYDIIQFDNYLAELKKEYGKENVNRIILNNLQSQTTTKKSFDVDAVIEIRDEINKQLDIINHKDTTFLSYHQMIEKYEESLTDIIKGRTYSTGCSYLDNKLVLKARPGYITSIFAATGLAKSTFALYLVSKQINKNISSALFSLENDNFLAAEKLLSNKTETPFSKMIYNQDFLENISAIIKDEKERSKKYKNFYFCDQASLSKFDLENNIIKIKNLLKTDYLLVTVDLASMLTDFGTTPNDIEMSMNDLHYMARRLNVHFILIFQANRETDSSKVSKIEELDKLRPMLGNIKNSNAIAERSRATIGLFRKKFYAEKYFIDNPLVECMDDILEAIVLKQNSGTLGVLKYLYNPELSDFTPYIENKKIDNA